MCDPVTATMAIGTVVTFASSMQNAANTKAAGKANQQIANQNAALTDMQAKDAIVRGEIEERNHRRRVAALKGEQQAAFAGKGIEIGSGTPLDVMSDTAQFGELDALTIRYNAKRESDYYKGAAANERYAGEVGYQQTKAQSKAQKIGAIGSLITDGGTVAQKWYKTRPSGTPGTGLHFVDPVQAVRRPT